MTEHRKTLRPDHRTTFSEGMPEFVREKKRARLAALRTTLEAVLEDPAAVVVEFGCGHGHWLTDYAAAHPDCLCLGLDLISARVRKAHSKRDRQALSHLHFLKAEASELLSIWPAGRPISAAFMLFPDPWPKKRHHKNRMIQVAFLDRLAELMPVGSHFHFRTDDQEYFLWATEHFEEHPRWAMDREEPWPWERETIFQMKMKDWSSLIAARQ